ARASIDQGGRYAHRRTGAGARPRQRRTPRTRMPEMRAHVEPREASELHQRRERTAAHMQPVRHVAILHQPMAGLKRLGLPSAWQLCQTLRGTQYSAQPDQGGKMETAPQPAALPAPASSKSARTKALAITIPENPTPAQLLAIALHRGDALDKLE